MPTWKVVNRTTGEVLHAYTSDAPVEWPGMEYANCNHIPTIENAPIQPLPNRRMTKLEFIDRLGDAAYVAILSMAKQSVEIEAFIKRFEMAAQDPDGTSIDLDDPRTVAGVIGIGAALEAQQIVSAGWAAGVLSGNDL